MKKTLLLCIMAVLLALCGTLHAQTEQFKGWSPLTLKTGDVPAGFTFKPMVDKKSGAWLLLSLTGSTDAIVKLKCMRGNRPQADDHVARVVYITNGEKYRIEKIPEGMYYIEVAYGNLYYKKKKKKKMCRFMEDNYFVRLREVLDFNVQKEMLDDGRTKVVTPRYELDLKLNVTNHQLDDEGSRIVENTKISEDEFYK